MRFLLFMPSLACGLLAVGAAGRAAVVVGSVSLNDAVGDPNATTVTAGQAFTVTARLNALQAFKGFSIALTDPGYTATPRFTITNRTRLATNPFVDPTKSDSFFAAEPIDDKTRDLGYTFDATAAAAGAYDLMTLTILTADNLAAGVYPIRFSTDSVLTSSAFVDLNYDSLTAYTVTVSATPEPAMLCGLMMAFLSGGRRNRSPRTSSGRHSLKRLLLAEKASSLV